MSQFEKELANIKIDWPKVHAILNDVIAGLESVVAVLPNSLAKTIILSVTTALHMVVNLLPSA